VIKPRNNKAFIYEQNKALQTDGQGDKITQAITNERSNHNHHLYK